MPVSEFVTVSASEFRAARSARFAAAAEVAFAEAQAEQDGVGTEFEVAA